uniref:Uncharacterized protein n=1 Tax=Steinernema glaseri TaxID=37863 RepID=A0A1I7YP73_9BILA
MRRRSRSPCGADCLVRAVQEEERAQRSQSATGETFLEGAIGYRTALKQSFCRDSRTSVSLCLSSALQIFGTTKPKTSP